MLIADLPELVQRAAVPGVSVATVTNSGIVCAAYGVQHAHRPEPVTPETLFEAASLSKPVFAYAVLGLVGQGVLDLDRPLAAYLPTRFVGDDDRLEEVTARHVLGHTTGWPNWRPRGAALRREAPPGERFGYSGEGFVYLQGVVEHLSGQPLEAFMQARVLRPLGMTRSSFASPGVGAAHLASGHNADGTPRPAREPQAPNAAFSLHATERRLQPARHGRGPGALRRPGACRAGRDAGPPNSGERARQLGAGLGPRSQRRGPRLLALG